MRAVAKRWPIVVQELRKCVLLCHNCHTEVHEGFQELPKNAAFFNEAYADYKVFELQKDAESWPLCSCGRRMRPPKRHCSKACAERSLERVAWDAGKLREMRARGLSKRRIGAVLGVSDKTVAERLTRYCIS
jgi:hypothetical protein